MLYEDARRAMVESQLRPSGVNDPAVIRAMITVPRELFVPRDRMDSAYSDRPIPLGGGREMNAPIVTGRLVNQLRVRAGERALLIGAACGYAAALLSMLGAEVVAVEEDAGLAAFCRGADVDAVLVEGPLALGHAAGAPYDFILIDGAVETIPDALVAQLRDGGRLAAALVQGGVPRLVLGRRIAGAFGVDPFADAEAVRLPGFAAPRVFTF